MKNTAQTSGRSCRPSQFSHLGFLWVTLGILAVLSQSSCSTNRGDRSGSETSPHAHGTIELDNGNKWTVDPPMMAHLRKIESAVRDFETHPGQNHPALAAGIQGDLGRLVTNCTMEGKAHDELHKWLLPFLGVTAEYADASDVQTQQAKLREIKQALLVFNDYFQ